MKNEKTNLFGVDNQSKAIKYDMILIPGEFYLLNYKENNCFNS